MQPKEAVQLVKALQRNDPDLLVACVFGAVVATAGYAALAGAGYGLVKLGQLFI
jgi:hypothetical protein